MIIDTTSLIIISTYIFWNSFYITLSSTAYRVFLSHNKSTTWFVAGFLMLTNSLRASYVYLHGCQFTLNLKCIYICYRYVWHICVCLCKKTYACQHVSLHLTLWMCHYLLYISFSCMSFGCYIHWRWASHHLVLGASANLKDICSSIYMHYIANTWYSIGTNNPFG